MDESVMTTDTDLRERAFRHLKKVRDFRTHLAVYLLFNGFVVVIWAMTGSGFFWPVFLIGFWGIGLAMNAWDVYVAEDPDEEAIQQEMRRLQQKR